MIDSKDSNAAAIIEAARKLGKEENRKPERTKIGDLEVLIHETSVHSLERFADVPRRKRANVRLYEAVSFIDYINRHKLRDRTHVFGTANELGGSFMAIIDYHQEEVPELQPTKAGWGDHVAALTLETTPEWKRWIGHNSKLLSQEQFAEFIEDNQLDIIQPAAADILDMAQLLQGKKTVTFRAGKNLHNGTVQLEYSEQIDAGRRDDSMIIPNKFKLGIIPFVGALGVEIEARLRFRIGDAGKLSFAYMLNRPYKVIEDAFKATRAEIEDKTGIKVMLGTGSIERP